jgi:putative oxidoreductase
VAVRRDRPSHKGLLPDVAWAFQVLAAAQFFLTGLDKLSDAPVMVQLFTTVGFGQWFRYFTGTVEVVGAVLLLMPRLAVLGAALLVLTMMGALVAHMTILPFSPAKVIVLLVMTAFVFWVRRLELKLSTP